MMDLVLLVDQCYKSASVLIRGPFRVVTILIGGELWLCCEYASPTAIECTAFVM